MPKRQLNEDYFLCPYCGQRHAPETVYVYKHYIRNGKNIVGTWLEIARGDCPNPELHRSLKPLKPRERLTDAEAQERSDIAFGFDRF